MSEHKKNQQVIEKNFTETNEQPVKAPSPAQSPLKPEVPEMLGKKKRDPEAFRKLFEKVGKIQIKPFVDKSVENMGLEKYDMVVFPGTYHEEQIAAIERHGVVRFITGLDEFAPEVQNIKDPEQKAAVIHNIRSIVAYLEKLLATNVIRIDDEEFWNKVKVIRPDNIDFWSKISIRCGNEPVHLSPADDPYDLIKFMAIEAGGFDLVAKSYDDALARPVAPKFYLDKETYTISYKTTYKKLRNKAIGILDSMSNKNQKKMLYVTKVIDSNSATYKISTPADILYDVLDDYINGKGIEGNKTRAAEHFISIAKLDMETLKLRALVKDASFYKFIVAKPDGMLYHADTATMLGRNVSDVVLYLKNPLNEDMLTKLLQQVETYWNQ